MLSLRKAFAKVKSIHMGLMFCYALNKSKEADALMEYFKKPVRTEKQ